MTPPGPRDQLDPFTRLEILDKVGCGIWLFDGSETRYVNQALATMTGYSRDELVQPGFFGRLLHPDYHDFVLQRGLARVRGDPVPEDYEAAIVTRSGDVLRLALHAKLVELPIGRVSLVSAVDLTQQRRAESARGESEAHYRSLLDSVEAHVMTTDSSGRATYVNRHWLAYTGLSLDESLRRGTADLIHPDDARDAGLAWRSALRSGVGYEIDYRIRAADGEYRWQSWHIQPVVLEERDVLGWIGVGMDTHTGKELQLALAESNARLQAANAVKDQFLSLVSHELRTPLTTISGLADVLARRLDTLNASDVRASVGQIQKDATRLKTIVENLLVLTRLDSERLTFEPVLLSRVADDVAKTLRSRFPGRRIVVVAERDVPPVLGVPGLTALVIQNLAENGAKYSSAGAPITIRVLNRAESVVVTVLDRGPGVRRDEQDRIFEPFYRSNAVQARVPGIGLGLTVCRRLVDLHQGQLTLGRRKGGGCAFEFSIPAMIDRESGALEVPKPARPLARR